MSWTARTARRGQGLGFNGGQLLGLAIGGCFCNDLHYVAHELGIRLAAIRVDVTLTFAGEPLLATGAVMRVAVTPADAHVDIAALIARARDTSTVSNSIESGVPVDLVVDDAGAGGE